MAVKTALVSCQPGSHAQTGINEIDINRNRRVSFIEYLLYRYNKTVDDLFAERDVPTAEALLEALERAIEAFQATLAQRQARDDKMKELEALAEVGGHARYIERRDACTALTLFIFFCAGGRRQGLQGEARVGADARRRRGASPPFLAL